MAADSVPGNDLLCTSSGPSTIRSVRALLHIRARGVSFNSHGAVHLDSAIKHVKMSVTAITMAMRQLG